MSLLTLDNLSIEFSSRNAAGVKRTARVLDGVSLQVGGARIVGLIGETGAGKSMTATSIIGMLPSEAHIASGSIQFDGHELIGLSAAQLDAVRGSRIGYVAQNPRAALEPVTRIGDQLVRLVQTHQTTSRSAARVRAIEMLSAVGIPDPESRYRAWPHELSGGMAQRVVIAMALINRPQLVIADEPTTGLDLTVQAQVLDLLRDRVRERSASALVITHDLGIVAQYCDDMVVMFAGQVIESGPVAAVFAQPGHPYTRRLIAASAARISERTAQPASPPDLFSRRSDCVYRDRCDRADAACLAAPAMRVQAGGRGDHYVRCHHIEFGPSSVRRSP
jgi:peptide/nickel transport system ATP-binding protein/oligopeptide transport system ATP-binding protein